MKPGVIVTVPPYANFLAEIARHPLVCGFRLNTVMPIHEQPETVLRRLGAFGQPVWVDLKGRQLRVVGAAIPPFSEVRLSHRIQVTTPVDVFFSDGMECWQAVAVDGDRLILVEGPRRLVGPGESVNIVDPSLKIEGTLTETDRMYLEAMRKVGLKQVMLSYVEEPSDAEEIRSLLPEAEIVLKIETQKGLAYAQKHRSEQGRLMAARGDLYVEVLRPHLIVRALREVIAADPQAFVASRIFDSLVQQPVPSCADIGDLGFLLTLGYRTFLLGDTQCLRRDTVLEALNLLQAVAEQF